jgi:hypothetical protein
MRYFSGTVQGPLEATQAPRVSNEFIGWWLSTSIKTSAEALLIPWSPHWKQQLMLSLPQGVEGTQPIIEKEAERLRRRQLH